MTGPDRLEDMSTDADRFEREQLARDRDADRAETADVTAAFARELVDDLIDADIVTACPDPQVFVHDPTGVAFRSRRQLAAFHRGWATARTGGGVDE
ncbi:hypothetical protein [Halobaculum roseum]|uniref:DUF8069 domain-containing protein n=1 Tax=Halobaculum roseum TaxID=2175149 RepID=A0ABD5MT04_9EURY|nr:hypothetical protein [Halobaculum roseum]QZY01881.1 hypothetical protein K6T36_11205 [Halobaculum roseum]